jgi:hypothetical protein
MPACWRPTPAANHGKPPEDLDWSDKQRQQRAVAEYLAAIDDTAEPNHRKTPKVISPSDPASAWTAKANKRVQFGYGLTTSSTSKTPSLSMWRRRRRAPTTRWQRRA